PIFFIIVLFIFAVILINIGVIVDYTGIGVGICERFCWRRFGNIVERSRQVIRRRGWRRQRSADSVIVDLRDSKYHLVESRGNFVSHGHRC
ncbi:hypothetical protein BGX38DRAFT_1190372, partial [Terfezia claveryi]